MKRTTEQERVHKARQRARKLEAERARAAVAYRKRHGLDGDPVQRFGAGGKPDPVGHLLRQLEGEC